MAEKEISNIIKLQIEAAKATPAPPVGPALGGSGVNIMQFVKEFNDRTANQAGFIIPVVITVYKDKTFSFITKVPLFGTLIGLQYCGKPIIGAINQPILKERILVDCKTCTFNGKIVRTANCTSLDGITLLTSDSRYCADLRGAKAWKTLEKHLMALMLKKWPDMVKLKSKSCARMRELSATRERFHQP